MHCGWQTESRADFQPPASFARTADVVAAVTVAVDAVAYAAAATQFPRSPMAHSVEWRNVMHTAIAGAREWLEVVVVVH
jgi:hypothetical protein